MGKNKPKYFFNHYNNLMMRKIAIVGTAGTSNLNAPYREKDWEIWTVGANIGAVPRIDLFFELHERNCLVAAKSSPGYFEDMKKLGNRLVLGHAWPDYPEATLYPKEDIINTFGRYFTSSIALMIAYAIQQGATEIGLWGVDMTADKDEYGWQKACCEYYLGVAAGRGIKVHIANESPLLRVPRVYGLEEDRFSVELTERWIELLDAVEKANLEVIKATKQRDYLEGMRDLVRDQITRWG